LSVKSKEQIRKQTIKHMKSLNTYKKEFDQIIDIYAGLVYQYQLFEQQFIDSGYQITEEHTNKVGATNQRKVPILTAMECLRKDIATYSDRLQLNAKALKQDTPPVPNAIHQQNEAPKSMTPDQYMRQNGMI